MISNGMKYKSVQLELKMGFTEREEGMENFQRTSYCQYNFGFNEEKSTLEERVARSFIGEQVAGL